MGAFEAAKDYNVEITFEGPEGDFAIAQQKNMLENALRKNPNAIILAATDSREILPIVEKINNMNIPIITFDSGIESDIPISSVSTNNKEAAPRRRAACARRRGCGLARCRRRADAARCAGALR
jgi:ribose transport system substrate-binding protein